jgi:hypothetical protein
VSTDTERTSFLGIPVEGDINHGSDRADQRPLSDLEPLIRAVLADEFVDSFGWRQYTPYFNDGEPCTFRLTDVWFRTVADLAADDDDFEEDSHYVGWGKHPTLGGKGYGDPGYTGDHEESWKRCVALSDAIDSDAFENVLLSAFGDHCKVVVRRDGITVDEYSHD